ncbi:uncharacterized protein LOC119652091 [Hermetia illucens]|uniref:uncharacterized protein LOC119652091 n=1 Tax=Hermetia illucens TaxID=343691 RepID=UPI0018CC550C|nr:uncharacterized protein LOC119652091 [Hermetia illucens]
MLQLKKAVSANSACQVKGKSSTVSVLLATALVSARGPTGKISVLRALIDPGSQTSFIALAAANKLALKKRNVLTSVLGIGRVHAATVRKTVELKIKPNFVSNFELAIEAYVLPALTTLLPNEDMIENGWMRKLQFANLKYNVKAGIDLGAEVFEEIVEPKIKKGDPLMAQKTKLGWAISMKVPIESPEVTTLISNISTKEFHTVLQRFFETEADHDDVAVAIECEVIYESTVRRKADGRYAVMLPFQDDPKVVPLGNSRNRASMHLKQLEKRLGMDVELKEDYHQAMQEYIDFGHMRRGTPFVGEDRDEYYLPHHPVVKMESTTTKIRPVYDASAKASSGSSLNDFLHTGPKLQELSITF